MMHKLEITFLSDWHIGEGSGQPGHIDKLVRRHPLDDLPYVPAKTITGIWRDACEQLALGLDNSSPGGNWQTWVTLLFGDQPNERDETQPYISPQAAAVTIRAARFPEALRQQLVKSPLKQALTFIKPSTKIDPETGQTIDKKLHFDEVVRAGAVLEAEIYLDDTIFTESEKQTAYALLWAGAQAVDRLGGKRRRGLGRCKFKFDALDKDEAIKKLKQPDKLPSQLSAKSAHQFKYEPATPTDVWLQVPLHLTLKSPLIVAQGELGNVVASLDYVPGTHLLGAVTKLLCQQSQLDLFNAVANGYIQVSHAYLEASETRGLPVPMALFYKKDDDSGQTYNRLMTTESGAQLKQHRNGYLIDNSLFKTPLQLTTHGIIEDKSQRPTEAVGGVFSFEAIKTGTQLQSCLKLHQSVVDQLKKIHGNNWWKVLNTDICLGKSKKDDYGWVQLRVENCELMSTPVSNNNQALTVWLCSDLLLRDSRLRPSTDIIDLQKELENHLDVKLSPRKTSDDTLSTLIRTTRTDGWHQNWGLPRASYIGLAAGSCIVFECKEGSLDTNKLQALMQRGLGERRAEGFGEVRFNPSLLSQDTTNLEAKELTLTDNCSHTAAETKTSPNKSTIKKKHSVIKKKSNTGNKIPVIKPDYFVATIEKAAWREDIRRAAVALSADSKNRHKVLHWNSEKPPNSQLGALRSVLSRMQKVADKNIVNDWLTHLQATDNRKDKWNKEALECIKSLLDDPQLIWNKLEENLTEVFPTLHTNDKAFLQEELWAEAIRTLFAVATHYEQRERE